MLYTINIFLLSTPDAPPRNRNEEKEEYQKILEAWNAGICHRAF